MHNVTNVTNVTNVNNIIILKCEYNYVFCFG